MKYITLILVITFALFNCESQRKTVNNNSFKLNKENLIDSTKKRLELKRDSIVKTIINDSNTIDSLFIGAKFFKYDAFKGFKYIEHEKSEIIETNADFHSTQLITLENKEKTFLCLISGNDLVDNHDYIWENMEKTINDIYIFNNTLNICWHPNNKDQSPTGVVAIGVDTKEKKETEINSFDIFNPCTLIDVDYKKGIIIIKNNNYTIYCSDGY